MYIKVLNINHHIPNITINEQVLPYCNSFVHGIDEHCK